MNEIRIATVSCLCLSIAFSSLFCWSCSRSTEDPTKKEYSRQIWCKYRTDGYSALLDSDYETARKDFQAALEASREADRETRVLSLCDIADLCVQTKQVDAAISLYREALFTIPDRSSRIGRMLQFLTLSGLGLALGEDSAEAQGYILQACQSYEEIFGASSASDTLLSAKLVKRYCVCEQALANSYIQKGNRAEAETLLQRAKECADRTPLSYDFRRASTKLYDENLRMLYSPRHRSN